MNIDGTVAAYRFPYLLAGNSVVVKQDSQYYEHFYSDLKPGVHYIPVKHDLSDLVDQLKWAQDHDREARQIGMNGRRYATENLLPKNILCYHAVLFKVCVRFSSFWLLRTIQLESISQKWSRKLEDPVRITAQMERVDAKSNTDQRFGMCDCKQQSIHSEL